MQSTQNPERMIEVNGVELCAQTFGNPDDPAVLLVMGLAASMLSWEDDFCERLANSRFVIRYDHRDTGRSVTYPPGAPGYTGDDLVADAVGLLDALGLSRAHVVGISMGGAIAQLLALDYADRVASLVLISTSPGTGDDLPGMSDELRAYFAGPPPEPDWSNREAVIDYIVEDERVYAAPSRPFEKAERRELAGRIFDRTTNIASMKNHWALDGGEGWRERLGEIRVPTLVLHGTEDPLFPIGHALALASEIPRARLIRLERTGHELPRVVWDVVVPEILQHTERARYSSSDR
jgi:pimeloyl-ACP methyl ester carboxylesterase